MGNEASKAGRQQAARQREIASIDRQFQQKFSRGATYNSLFPPSLSLSLSVLVFAWCMHATPR